MQYLTVQEYADWKGCTVQNVYQGISRNTIPHTMKKVAKYELRVMVEDTEYEKVKA